MVQVLRLVVHVFLKVCHIYAFQKLQVSHIYFKEEQRLSMKAIFDRQDVFIWLPTGQAKKYLVPNSPFFMDFKRNCMVT